MIIRNIIKFLKSEDQLYINDLGLFKKVYKGAVIVGNQLLPPHYQLVLEESATGNGFAFILFVSKQEKLRIVDADMAIKTWIDSIKKQIAEQGFAHFENFGKFTKKKEVFIFENDLIEDLNRCFEGMSSVELPSVEKRKGRRIEKIVASQVPIAGDTNKPLADNEPLGATRAAHRISNQWLSWMFFVLTILFSLLFFVFLFYDTIELKIEERKWKRTIESIAPMVGFDSIFNAQLTDYEADSLDIDSLNSSFLIPEFSQAINDSAMIDEKKSEFLSASNKFEKIEFEKGKYYVIAGSFDTERRAVEHATLKQKQGFTPQLLYQEYVSKIRICVGIYVTEEEALQAIPQGNDFWILQ